MYDFFKVCMRKKINFNYKSFPYAKYIPLANISQQGGVYFTSSVQSLHC